MTGVATFSGSSTVLGEFGWIAAITMLLVGVLTTTWHLRQDGSVVSHQD